MRSLTAPGWERDDLGYIAKPDKIYELCALSYLARLSLFLRYDIHENVESDGQHGLSLENNVESVLAIYAAARLPLKTVELSDKFILHGITTGGPGALGAQWDMAMPLLDAACALVHDLTIDMTPETKDLKWIESFLVKCSNLRKLSVKFVSLCQDHRDLPHLFYDNIAAKPALLIPVERLTLEENGFTQTVLSSFVGRFKNTLRSLELHEISVEEDEGWAKFFTWLRENAPQLREFQFEVLRQGSGEGAKAVSFGSLRNGPVAKRPQVRDKSFRTGAGGILLLRTLNSVCEDLSAYRLSFRGSIRGAQEILGFLARAAAPQVPPAGYIRSPFLV